VFHAIRTGCLLTFVNTLIRFRNMLTERCLKTRWSDCPSPSQYWLHMN